MTKKISGEKKKSASLFKKSLSGQIQPPPIPATMIYLLSPVDPQQNLAADVAVLSWL